jgi:tyrosinase
MAVVRRNILTDSAARDAFVDGVIALKQDQLGTTTRDIGFAGPPVPVSTYDLFIVWHHLAMHRTTPPTQNDRNSAHSGPVFLPWHRLMLLLFELNLQRVLGDSTVGLPYWDWAADGDLAPSRQPGAPLWQETGIGGTGNPVTGPFGATRFRVRIESGPRNELRATDRPLARDLGGGIERLPTRAEVDEAVARTVFDAHPWNRSSQGFRNRIEGWDVDRQRPYCHNQVHVWVGGDMSPASSPNDPAFYLNHCNADRIWERWMLRHGRTYVPGPGEPDDLDGHRLNDRMYSLLTAQPVTPADVLDVSRFSTYDTVD